MGLTFSDIDTMVEMARAPLSNLKLEGLQSLFLGQSQSEHYYRFLYHLITFRRPHVALEIGVAQGIGSLHMVEAGQNVDCQVIGLDLNPVGIHRENYSFVLGDSTEVFWQVQKLVEQYGRIGVVYQDSSHHYEASCQEWELYTQLLATDAIWVCDDITPAFKTPAEEKGMVEYFEERPGQKKLYQDVLHFGNTQGVILVEG